MQEQLYVIDEKINKAIHAHKDLEAAFDKAVRDLEDSLEKTTNQMYLDHGYAKAQAE